MKEKRGTLQTPFLSFNQKMLGSPPYDGKNKALDTSQGLTGKKLGMEWGGLCDHTSPALAQTVLIKGVKADGAASDMCECGPQL